MRLALSYLLLFFLLASCQKVEDESLSSTAKSSTESTEKGQLSVTCTSTQDWDASELTRATTNYLISNAKHATFIILSADDNKLVYRGTQQNGGGNSFPSLSVSLTPGNYNLLIYADNCDSIPSISDSGIVTPKSTPREAYSFKQAFTITSGKTKTISAKLLRCVAELEFTSSDEMPTGLETLQYTLSGISLQYDLLNQKGCGDTQRSVNATQVEKLKYGTSFNCNSYVFLPSASSTVNAEFVFANIAGSKTYSTSVKSIPAKINQYSCITVSMFDK